MAVTDMKGLLIEAPVGRHFAQFHRDKGTLAEAVGLFIETGLRRGTGVVVIATNEHTERFLLKLEESGVDAELFRRAGQFRLLDAHAVLARFMRAGMPNWAEFRLTIGTVLESVQTFGKSSVRAYGEMVNVLWQEGNPQAAIRLEEYWNELAKIYPFSLFCSYMLDSHSAGCYLGPLHDIGRTHSEVLATEHDDRFRIALDAACRDIFGIPLSQTLSLSGFESSPGEHRLPSGQRTMLWIMRNMPARSAEVLDLARRYYTGRPS